MTLLTAIRQIDFWKMIALVPLVLSPALAHRATYADTSAVAITDANEAITVKNVWADVPLTQVLRDISMETGVAIVTCPHVPDQLVSLDTGSGKPLRDCMEELLSGLGVYVHQKGKKFYLIGCGAPTCPSSLEMADSERLCLKYISAKHLQSCLPKSLQQYVSVGQRENEVLLYAVLEIMEHVMEIVAKVDVPPEQVVLEVLVVELWEEATEEFGLDWEYSDHHNNLSMEEGLGFFTGMAQYTSVPKSQLTRLLFTLRALVGKNKATIRSRPRVATQNGEKAIIDISLEEYFTIVTDIYDVTGLRTDLKVIKTGVLLEITPHIGDNNDITVDVVTEVSDVASRQNQIEGNASGDLPLVRRRKVDTCVRVKEGDAIVIGGLIETQEQNNVKKVPILGDIPLVGGLFRSTKIKTIEKEVIIFITPQLIKEGKIAFSDGHNLIDAEEELDALRGATALPDTGKEDESSGRELP